MRASLVPRIPISLGLIGALALVAPRVRADVSSWIGLGAGASQLWRGGDSELVPSLRMETGVGSPPGGRLIVGGVFGVQTHLSYATDLTLALRTATHHYVNGGWGAAIDLGGYHRFERISNGFVGSLTLGAPWGITASMGGTVGTEDMSSIYGLLGFDFARLTVYRRSGGRWWPNTLPAYRPEEETR